MRLTVASGALAVVMSAVVAGQNPAVAPSGKPPSFEVASVRPSNPNPPDPLSGMPRLMPIGGRLTVANVPLRLLIRVAYDVQDFQIVGGPSDLLSRKFDITAKAEEGTGRTLKEMSVLLRTLLADRFALEVRTEAREAPIYALVVARKDGTLGPAMKVSASECGGFEDAETPRGVGEGRSGGDDEGPGCWAHAVRNPAGAKGRLERCGIRLERQRTAHGESGAAHHPGAGPVGGR